MEGITSLYTQRVYLDTNIFVYAFEALPPWDIAAQSLLASVESGRIVAVTSEITLAECLVKPMKLMQNENVEIYKQAFRSSTFLTLTPVSRELLIAAAEIRALSGCKLPDAIHVATARFYGCTAFITNDRQLSTASHPRVILISDVDPNS